MKKRTPRKPPALAHPAGEPTAPAHATKTNALARIAGEGGPRRVSDGRVRVSLSTNAPTPPRHSGKSRNPAARVRAAHKPPAHKIETKDSPITNSPPTPKITLGPLFYNWPANKRRDFYFRIADEAAIDVVYLGEVVCSKRETFFQDHLPAVADRLLKAGKEVVYSTLALVTSEREMAAIAERAHQGCLIEANDVACLLALNGKPHVVGPFINVFNESAKDFVVKNKARRIVLPVEMPATSIGILAQGSKTEIEVQVFGRQPLSVAMRCYHARAYGLNKDSCRFVCGNDPDGLPTDTMDGQPILAVNGTQTLSHGYVVLLDKLAELRKMGVTHFRLSPQDIDMPKVAALYRDAMNEKSSSQEAFAKLRKLTGDVPYINGFYHGREGLSWINAK